MSTHLLNPARDLNIGTSNVHNVIINNGPITGQSPDISLAEARERLNNARAVEAGQTSDTAAQATKCSPGTREQIIADITDWATEGSLHRFRTLFISHTCQPCRTGAILSSEKARVPS